MSGFKEGAASSGLGSDDGDDEDEVEDKSDAAIESELADSEPERAEGPGSNSGSTKDSGGGQLPWIYSRSGITDGRAKTVQLHLQKGTLRQEHEARTELEEQLGETVNKADLREAAYLVGLSQLDDVADQLREWGYDFGE